MKITARFLLPISVVLNIVLLALIVAPLRLVGAQAQSLYFPETGHTIQGFFLAYWQDHGGLAQQGYPLTEEFQEKNKLNGKIYTVQYFERAIFERHPENAPPYDVLLTPLGKLELDARYPDNSNPAQATVAAPPAAPTETKTPRPSPTNTPSPTATRPPSPTPQPPSLSVPYCQSQTDFAKADVGICLQGQQGDYIVGPHSYVWTPDNSVITVDPTNLQRPSVIGFNIHNEDRWSMQFAGPDGKPLYPGRYPNVARYPFYNPVFGGMTIDGAGRGCNESTSSFEVLQIVVDPTTGELKKFAVNFTQSCENFMPPLMGEIRYHSSVKP